MLFRSHYGIPLETNLLLLQIPTALLNSADLKYQPFYYDQFAIEIFYIDAIKNCSSEPIYYRSEKVCGPREIVREITASQRV